MLYMRSGRFVFSALLVMLDYRHGLAITCVIHLQRYRRGQHTAT